MNVQARFHTLEKLKRFQLAERDGADGLGERIFTQP
jgi:hypothetical protein